jgi:hypothetical protein
MGCFLTTTRRDLDQIKSRMGGPSTNRSRQAAENKHLEAAAFWMTNFPLAYNFAVKSKLGKGYHEMGKEGEQIAERVLEQKYGFRIVERATAKGVDLSSISKGGYSVSVEVKTSLKDKDFGKMLSKGYGHRQCSDPWLSALGIDPARTTVMGVQINALKETVSVYSRLDSNATQWICILKDAPLAQFNIK